ncbi:MAG: hypothetical protein HDT30_07485 [Clostridiales bacterium]|nr:hypothetical protein [Clostridiales bacterium]
MESKEKKVVNIMMILYDEEETIRTYVESQCYDGKVETALRMIADGD